MRTLSFVIIVLVVAGAAAAVIALSGGKPDFRTADAIDTGRVEALERDLARARQDIENLRVVVGDLSAQGVTAGHAAPAAGPGRATPAEAAPVVQASSAEAPDQDAVTPGPEGDIRQLIREEMKKVEEERIEEMKKRSDSWKAEQWEIDEFKELAASVHRMGVVLDLTDKQKRLYHTIIKDFGERIRPLWNELQERNPGAEMPELQKLYKEESDRMTRNTREQVEDILTPEQRKKYREECGKNPWFK